jgi:transcriptional regulator with XRE-family HTH domain
MGSSFSDLWNDPNFISDERRAEIDLEVALIGKLIEAREEKGITQQQLAEMSGLKQSSIARLEKMSATPQIDTLLKVLIPLGYTLAIVPKEQLSRN